jgi:hypothetical protein
VHHWDVGQVPFEPLVTSNRLEEWPYGIEFAYVPVAAEPVLPLRAYTEEMIGEASLVPPNWPHVEDVLEVG